DLIERSHVSRKEKAALRARAESLLHQLQTVGVVLPTADGGLELAPDLQDDFTLHHSLSLFLLEGLARLDAESPTFALDVLTWVESILEHPRPVLLRQVAREKDRLIADLKAQGVPYEERMEALEDVTWPRPLADAIYAFYNAYREKHPWVGEDPIRPKAVAREMAETWASFAEYVRELGLERVEGVLLRYLSEV